MNERNFYTPIFVCSIMLTLFLNFTSCKNETKKTATSAPLFFELSLAQWSFHRTFREGGVSPYEFAERANDLGFKGLEYVNALYPDVMESNDKDLAISKFIEQNIVRDWSNKTHIFNFSINKSRIHRYLLLEEIKRLNLTQYTYSLPWLVNNVNDIPVTDYKFGPETQLPTAIKNGKFKNAETYDKLLKKTVFEPSCISIITEPCYFEHEAMVTEKTFMAMMGGTIPLWFGGWKNAQSLKQYGFDVFDDIVYHGYETLEDPRERCVQALERNLHLFDDIRLLKTWLENNKTRLQHNVDLLLDNVFLKKCFDIIHTSDAELKRALLRITPSFLRQKITADIEQYIEESEQLDYQRLP